MEAAVKAQYRAISVAFTAFVLMNVALAQAGVALLSLDLTGARAHAIQAGFEASDAISLLLAGIFAVVVLIGFTSLGPTVSSGVNTYSTDPYLDTASSNLASLGTMLYTVAILVIAAFPAVIVMGRITGHIGRTNMGR